MSDTPDGYETLLWEMRDGVATITLNRPEKKNAMSWRMFEEIQRVFEAAAVDDEVRVVVLTGAGGAFCTGADLTDPENAVGSGIEMKDRMAKVHEVVSAFRSCPKPVIAKVSGIAAGAGCNLALGCDLIVASTDAAFAELFVKRGLVVDFGGTWVLSRALPLHRAKELALLGETITAEEADRWGMLNRLCDPSDLDKVTDDLAGRLAALPPKTIAMIKDNLDRAGERSLDETLAAESLTQSLALTTEDTREAVFAWIEKRDPVFRGR